MTVIYPLVVAGNMYYWTWDRLGMPHNGMEQQLRFAKNVYEPSGVIRDTINSIKAHTKAN